MPIAGARSSGQLCLPFFLAQTKWKGEKIMDSPKQKLGKSNAPSPPKGRAERIRWWKKCRVSSVGHGSSWRRLARGKMHFGGMDFVAATVACLALAAMGLFLVNNYLVFERHIRDNIGQFVSFQMFSACHIGELCQRHLLKVRVLNEVTK